MATDGVTVPAGEVWLWRAVIRQAIHDAEAGRSCQIGTCKPNEHGCRKVALDFLSSKFGLLVLRGAGLDDEAPWAQAALLTYLGE